MAKTMKRLLSFLLSICIIVSTLSMVVLAEDGEMLPKFEVEVSSILSDGETTTRVVGTVDADYNAKLTIPNAEVNAGNVTVKVTMNNVDSLDVPDTKSHSVTLNTGVNAQGNLFDVLNGLACDGLRNFTGAKIRANVNGTVVTYELTGAWDDEVGKSITGTPETAEAARTAWHAMVNDANFIVEEQETDNSYFTIANGSWLQIGSEALVFETEGDLKVDPSAADSNLVDNIREAVKVIETEDAALAFVLKKGTALAVGGSVATLAQDIAVTVAVDTEGLTVLSGLRDAVAEFEAVAMIKSLLGWMDTAVKLVDNAPGEIAVDIAFGTFDNQPAEKGEEPPIGAYNLRESIANKLAGAKFVGVVASTNLNGETTEVVGTVDENYNAKLHIPNADVNANSLWLGVGMNGVESLGGGQRIHALPEKHLMGESGSGAQLNIFETLNGAGFTALKKFDGATINATIVPVSGENATVTYRLAGEWNDTDGKTITGTPDSADAARTAWHTMVNDTNFATPANNGDSHIVVKSGSWLQIGDQRLQFTKGKGDITLFTADGDDVASICDKVELANGEADMTLAFLLKEGTTLAVGDSSAVLKNDVLVNVTGIAAEKLTIDGKNALVALREAVNSGETLNMVDLLVQLAGVMDTAVAAVDGSTIGVTMQFICNHALVATPAKAATCTEDGNIAYWTCEKCGKIYSDEAGTKEITQADTVIEAVGHKMTKTEATAATCTTAGNKAYWTCGTCNKIYSDEAGMTETTQEAMVIQAAGHKMTKTEASDPTCTTTGNTTYWTCGTCNKIYSDEAGITETTQTAVTIPANGHSYGEPAWNWTKTVDDWTATATFACANCEDKQTPNVTVTSAISKNATCAEAGVIVYTAKATFEEKEYMATKDVAIDKIAHTAGAAVPENVVAATCTAPGSYDEVVYCTECKAELSREKKTIPVIAHTLTKTESNAPTCTEAGNIAYWTCSECDKKFSDAEGTTEVEEVAIAKLEHALVNHEAKAATCTEIGWNAYVTCSRDNCGYTTYEEIAATGHSLTATAAKAATCTEAGNIAYWTCGTCNKIFSDEAGTTEITQEATVTPETGHTYGELVWAADHTTVTRTCTACNDAQTATAVVTSEVTTEATYSAAGVRTYTATATFTGETEAVTTTWTEEIPRLRRSGGGGSKIDRPGNSVTVTDPVVTPPEVIIPDDKPPLSDLPISTVFTDVADDAWYAEAVQFVSSSKLMIGVGDGDTFAPTLDTTRSMIAMILYRIEGEPSVADLNVTFPDVAESDWYHDAAVWALENGVFVGFDDGTFRGGEIITREQLAAVFHRYAESKGFDLSDTGTDLSQYIDESQIGDWAASAVRWAVSAGLMSGRSETTIAPQGNTQRAELATVLMRFHEKYNILSEGTEIH